MQEITQRIGYTFSNAALLREALTHRSFGVPHNERLEFLGDGVLNCVIAQALFERFLSKPEGDLSRIRANLVNQQSLFEIALTLDLGQHLMLGEGELKSGGAKRPSILADATEALIGAVFIDGGFAAASTVVRRLYGKSLENPEAARFAKDAKTELQELLQGRRLATPVYSVVAVTGEAHDQLFTLECAVADLQLSCRGEGPSRRAAEQNAARAALQLLDVQRHD